MRIIQALLFALIVGLFAIPNEANAQASVSLWCWNPTGSSANNNQYLPCNSTTPLQIAGSLSASLSGFRPVSAGTPISVTSSGVTGTLPTNTGEVVATNVGATNGAYCALGASATTSSQYIAPNGGWFAFAISGDTQLTCITSSSTTTVNMVGGSGLPTGTGGGGGGSGGAVFGPTAVGSAAANPPVLFGGTANGTATGNVAVAEIKTASSAVVGDPGIVVSDPVVASALNSAPPVNVNGTPTGVTGLTPGVAQTGTIIAQNFDITSVKGTAVPKGGVPVINGGNTYQLFAASTGPTAFTGGGGGAIGDYLSHCTVFPTTTSPGVVTILDSTTAIYSFPGGASSLSNLVPFAIPIGANSKIAAWNVTLGAGVSMVCEGKPT